jgi:phosphatidylethanolamine-binding protein (PEBP) family uncharacterized protein
LRTFYHITAPIQKLLSHEIDQNRIFGRGKNPQGIFYVRENKILTLHLEFALNAAKSLALIVDDPDANNGTFTHWLLFRVAPHNTNLLAVPPGAQQGINN